jgi:glycosyltransferase involved in cell wall biosynthesis
MNVSIALCTFNGERFLHEQLMSLIRQTHAPSEIVICDDASTDQTLAIINEVKSKTTIPIYLHQNKPALGVFKNFEKCIGLCQSPIIFPCDQDDVWLPNKIEQHIKKHQENNELLLVFSNADVVSEDLKTSYYPLWKQGDMNAKSKHYVAGFDKLIVKGQSVAGCCMSFKRDFFEKILPIPDGIYHDDWIATSAFMAGQIWAIPHTLMKYRQHDHNVVGIVRGSKLSFYKSLVTNPMFYMKADAYIAQRHKVIYQAMMNHTYLSSFAQTYPLQAIINLYSNRSFFNHVNKLSSVKRLSSSFIRGEYRYLNGVFSYLRDVYDLVYLAVYDWIKRSSDLYEG